MVRCYEEQVYAGVLGKVIGVYMGRPVEGWTREKIAGRWGMVDRYVHEECSVPLVVADDDISGTLTFPRILEDCGLYAATPVERYGDNWLNYVVPLKSILWWGGVGMSSEHTAFMRLVSGIPAPRSGSCALNGRTVAEQIGAQIFIDGFGLVAPAQPDLAAEMARNAASVSHDGEAVFAAMVVAAMVSAAFVEKDMDRLLDGGVGCIPSDSLIARVHRDVRSWCRDDSNWERVFERIEQTYGYTTYGGGCHIVPNHALMVMAWSLAPDNFRLSQAIINSAGWDTDCNAANVGCVMGVKLGLEGINRDYDFQGPMGDRITIPTAEGTHSVTDCLVQALGIARIGRAVMGWEPLPAPKEGAQHHFSLPGSRHGWLPDEERIEYRGKVQVFNAEGTFGEGRVLRIESRGLCAGRGSRILTPVCTLPESAQAYTVEGTPKLYSGMTVRAAGHTIEADAGAGIRLFVQYLDPVTRTAVGYAYGTRCDLVAGAACELDLEIPDTQGWPVCMLGMELDGSALGRAVVEIDTVRWDGTPCFTLAGGSFPRTAHDAVVGWITTADLRWNNLGHCHKDLVVWGSNEGWGQVITGNREWRDYAVEADIVMHCGEAAGIVARWQGLRRYLALEKHETDIRLVKHYYDGAHELARAPLHWEIDTLHTLRIELCGTTIRAWADGTLLCTCCDDTFSDGGAGLAIHSGAMGMQRFSIAPLKE